MLNLESFTGAWKETLENCNGKLWKIIRFSTNVLTLVAFQYIVVWGIWKNHQIFNRSSVPCIFAQGKIVENNISFTVLKKKTEDNDFQLFQFQQIFLFIFIIHREQNHIVIFHLQSQDLLENAKNVSKWQLGECSN